MGPSSRTGTTTLCLEHEGTMGGQLSFMRKEERREEDVRVMVMMSLIGERGRGKFERE